MARKLKAFTTSAGFFDLAVSAPSMKAALDAWGAGANLFHQGFARQTDDPAIVEATMARPGIVLRRPVGSDETFTEEAEASSAAFGSPSRRARPRKTRVAAKPVDPKAERQSSLAFEKERQRRERRDRAIAAAQAALDQAGERHAAQVAEIKQARAVLDTKADREAKRWQREKGKLEETLERAREPRPLRPL